jgi:hypothetical protein
MHAGNPEIDLINSEEESGIIRELIAVGTWSQG